MNKIKAYYTDHPFMITIHYFIVYTLAFGLINLFNNSTKLYINCAFDQQIPFIEIFVVPYLLWFVLLVGSILYFYTHNKADYLRLCFMMYVSMSLSILFYIICPNEINIRVSEYPTNIFGTLVKLLQTLDNPTNVCPSIHVSSTMVISIAMIKSTYLKENGHKSIAIALHTLSFLIILSTMFIKQHSIIDVAWGLVLAFVMDYLVYHSKLKRIFEEN